MIDTQSIRAKILDLAMRGQLTEQLPEDGSVETLYSEIETEKQALIKSGIIKKEKPLAVISEEDRPFAIPSRWRWVYLGELFQHNTGKALNSSDTQGQKLEYITTSNLYWDRFILDDLKTMPFTDSEIEKCTVKKGDLLVCEGGDIGRSAIWPYDYDIRIQNHIHRLRKYSASICTEFYYYLLWLYKQTGRINGIGIGLQGFSAKRVHSLVVPLVPTKEAERVVEVIKQAFSVLDTIDVLQAQYADNLTVLKTKLIDAASQGKLTEQLPEDGTAEELYQQIQEEKQSLITYGKVKKEKPLPAITADEIPFEIPNNWKWCRLADIASTNIGLTYHPEDVVDEGTIVVRSSNIINSRMDYTDLVKVKCSIRENQYLNNNDIVICARNGSKALVGKCAIYKGESGVVSFGAFMAVLRTPFYKYVYYYLLTDAFRRYFHSDDSKQINQVTQNILKEAIIPLPPLAEQERIVAKLDEAISMICNG